MSLSSSPQSSPSISSTLFRRLPRGVKKIILWALASTQLILAQDNPQDTHHTHAQNASIAQDVNLMHTDDPSEEALDHLMPNDHHKHTIAEMHYSHNHATPDGTLELGELAGVWIHTRIPISHGVDSSTALKFWLHGLLSMNHPDNRPGNQLDNELTLDVGFIHSYNRWKLSAGVNFLHEESSVLSSHTSEEVHLDSHWHPHTTTHTETSLHNHEYTWLWAYIDLAHQFEFSGILKDKVSAIVHVEHDESLTGNGNFASFALQMNRLSLGEKLHLDASIAAIFRDGERSEGRNFCLMPGVAIHYMLNPSTTFFLSGIGIIPPQHQQGFAGSVGFSYKFK